MSVAPVAGLRRLQRRARSLRDERYDAGNRRGRAYAFASLTPILPGRWPEVARLLRGFGVGDRSPLATLPDVHFARWVVIDQLKTDWPGAPRDVPRLESAYLLFTADLTPPRDDYPLPEAFLRELLYTIPAEVHAIWSHCCGYPRAGRGADVVRYLARSQIDTTLYYAAHPDATVREIRDALALRDALIAFVRDHQRTTDNELLRRLYLNSASKWFGSI